MANEQIETTLREFGITVESEFVPFSQSRNAKPREDGKIWRSLNWRVTVKRNGREILTTDYSAGDAQCPAYNDEKRRRTVAGDKVIEHECETGFPAAWTAYGLVTKSRKRILPNTVDVIAALVADSDVLDSVSFEDWASEVGFDTDSRKAESIYRECLALALRMRAGFGEDGLAKLREVFADY